MQAGMYEVTDPVLTNPVMVLQNRRLLKPGATVRLVAGRELTPEGNVKLYSRGDLYLVSQEDFRTKFKWRDK